MSAESTQHLVVEQVRHAYGSHVVLDDVSFAAKTGDVIGIVGRNGAGKSTLLRIVAGLIQPTSGRVSATGRVTAVMTLGLGLYEDLSGRQNAQADFDMHGRPRADWPAADAAIEHFAELGEFYDRPVRTYSTGMKSRLSFAILTHVEPEILIIDEALSAGDSVFATKAYARLRALCAQGSIVLIVSHSMGAIRELCTRCLWLDGGRIRLDGTPDIVTEQYHDEVRESDDAELLHGLRKRLSQHEAGNGFELSPPVFTSGPDEPPRSLAHAGEPLRVCLAGRVPPAAERQAPLDLRVVIERLDGLVMLDSHLGGLPADVAPAGGKFDVTFEQNPCVLGVGRYLVIAELLAGTMTVAHSGAVIEIAARHPPSGGHPLLLAPFEMELIDEC